MTLILVKNNDLDIIDENPWWDLTQIRKVVAEDGYMDLQLKECRAILCANFDEPSLADTCLSFLPIKVQIRVFNHYVKYHIFPPFFSSTYSIDRAPWPIKICNGLIDVGNIQDSKTMSMMSSGWTIICWWERDHYIEMLSDTKGRCRAFYESIKDLSEAIHNGEALILPDFRILTTNGWEFLLLKSEKMVVIDPSDPPPQGVEFPKCVRWSREHYFRNHRSIL
jgi:hypothetical protein